MGLPSTIKQSHSLQQLSNGTTRNNPTMLSRHSQTHSPTNSHTSLDSQFKRAERAYSQFIILL